MKAAHSGTGAFGPRDGMLSLVRLYRFAVALDQFHWNLLVPGSSWRILRPPVPDWIALKTALSRIPQAHLFLHASDPLPRRMRVVMMASWLQFTEVAFDDGVGVHAPRHSRLFSPPPVTYLDWGSCSPYFSNHHNIWYLIPTSHVFLLGRAIFR